jgi:hypothetical protein
LELNREELQMKDDGKIVVLNAFVSGKPGKAPACGTLLLCSRVRRRGATALALMAFAGASQLGAQASARSEGSAKPMELAKSWNGSALLRLYSKDVRNAEGAGVAYPRLTATDGKNVRRCVEADGDATGMPNTVRSGEFTVGAFSVYAERWRQGAGHLWWQPVQLGHNDTLIVEARRVDGPADRRIYRESNISRDALAEKFSTYQLPIQLPSPGVWLLTAHAGTNWGCVLFAFQ